MLAAAIALLALSSAAGAGETEGFGCSNATRGASMYANSGCQSLNPSFVPLAVTGKNIFYGNGKFDSLATLSIGGTIIPNDAAPGTYTIQFGLYGHCDHAHDAADSRCAPAMVCCARRRPDFFDRDRSGHGAYL